MTSLLDRIPSRGAASLLVLAELTFAAVSAQGAQPFFATPAGEPLLPSIIYAIPYAYSTVTPGNGLAMAETIVTIGPLVTGSACTFQVEWVNWDGTPAGVSGGGGAPPIPAGGSFEFTTETTGAPLFPFIPNIGSNIVPSAKNPPFEGYAFVRTDCGSTQRADIDAEVWLNNNGISTYKPIEPIRANGNFGD